MPLREKGVAVLLAICAVTVWTPAAAGAEEAHSWSEFQLEGSDGFRIGVERDGPFFSLSAGNGPTGVIYSALTKPIGAAEPTAVEADLGKLGAIDVQFEASAPPRRLPNQPTGCVKTKTRGHFVGSISFHGELDYTRVDATQATGTLSTTEGDCDTFDRPGFAATRRAANGPPGVSLAASRKFQGRTVQFACNRGEGSIFIGDNPAKHPQRRYFEAAISEKYLTFNVIRLALAASDNRGSFGFDESLTAATVKPPAPFTGAATYRRPRGGQPGTWAGSLSVSFPGAPDTPLAGPGFKASIETDRD